MNWIPCRLIIRNDFRDGDCGDPFSDPKETNKREKERELRLTQITEFIEYRRNWNYHTDRIGSGKVLEKLLKYRPTRKGSLAVSITGRSAPDTETDH